MSQQSLSQTPSKKIKLNAEQDKQWIVIKKKTSPLTIGISDHNKVNRFYSHKSIQKYIRYLLTQTCPNPMWLSIKRQSQIQHIYYIDIQIQDYLYDNMIEKKQLEFLSKKVSADNRAVFKDNRVNRYIWDSLLIYDQQIKPQQDDFQQFVHAQKKMTPQVYYKYLKNTLTPQQLKQNLYPDLKLTLYKNYHSIKPQQSHIIQEGEITNDKVDSLLQNEKSQQKGNSWVKFQNLQQKIVKLSNQHLNNANLILVIDCQMVTTQLGFELARCTILNYHQQVILDEFFKPLSPILNYNTQFSGITQQLLQPISNTIQSVLHPFLNKIISQQTILIGHSLQNDFNAMKFTHNKVVDTSVLFKRKNGCKMKLKSLAGKILKRQIQHLTHDSKQDCLATLHLVQLKIQSPKQLFQQAKQFHLLRDLVKHKHNVLIVDYDIDQLRSYNSFHFEKTQFQEDPNKICSIIKKYSDKNQVCVPKLVLSRIQRRQDYDWEQYYQQIDTSLADLYNTVPQGTVFFLNHQINQTVRIIPSKQDTTKLKTRSFLAVVPKST